MQAQAGTPALGEYKKLYVIWGKFLHLYFMPIALKKALSLISEQYLKY